MALGAKASVVVAHGLSCPTACGILVPRAGIEPMSSALAGRCLTTGPQGSPGFVSLYRTVVKKQSYGQRHLLNKEYCVRQSILLAQVSQASPGSTMQDHHRAGSGTAQRCGKEGVSHHLRSCLHLTKSKWQTALLRMKRGGEGGGGWDRQHESWAPSPSFPGPWSLSCHFILPSSSCHGSLLSSGCCQIPDYVFTIILSKKIHHDYGDLTSQSKN